MEVIDRQEFTIQDFSTFDNQNIFNSDTDAFINNEIDKRSGSHEFNTYDTVSLSAQRIEKLANNNFETAELLENSSIYRQNANTINSFAFDYDNYSQLGDNATNDGLSNNYNYDILTGKNYSFQTADTLMSNGEAAIEDDNFQLLEQATPLDSTNQSLLQNSDFSQDLNQTNWIIGKKGKVREYDRNVEPVAYIENVPGQGRQMYLKLPQEAKVNYEDQLSLFQDVSNLRTDKVYAVEARVKWLNPENDLPSAIVSFWAKNPDNSFRGKDFVITDGDGYKNIRFEFTPTELGTTRFFLGLFTHVEGNIDDTEIYVDDYKVTEIGDVANNLDTRKGNLLRDGGFNNYTATPPGKRFNRRGWNYTVQSPVPGLEQSIQTVNQNKLLRLEFPKAENYKDENNTSVTGVYQNVRLIGGQSYELSADFHRQELDSFGYRENSLVQFIAYRKQNNGEDVFLGPIDVELTNNNPVSKSFNLIAPETGRYTILVRLAGWGNEGNGVVVDVDNVSLKVN